MRFYLWPFPALQEMAKVEYESKRQVKDPEWTLRSFLDPELWIEGGIMNGLSRRKFVSVMTKGAIGAAALNTFGPYTTRAAAAQPVFSTGVPVADPLGIPGRIGCGANFAGEPAIHVSRANTVILGSERGLGGGSDAWRALGGVGGPGALACNLEYRGQPNAVASVGASGGDIDLAIASQLNGAGAYTIYVASLNLGSVAVATSTDNGATWTNVPVQAGLPLDDREWIAAFGADISLLTFHDIATFNINVLRSDHGGLGYLQIAQVLSPTDYRVNNNQIGNLVIDRRNTAGTKPNILGLPSFWAYQSLVAPSNPRGSINNQAFVGVSHDGGFTWTPKPIACSASRRSLDHQFPNISVAPDGVLWAAWSDDVDVFTAFSPDHGDTWFCSGRVSTNTRQAVMPWLVATSAGVDLVYYGSPDPAGPAQRWFVYFVQNLTGLRSGWGTPVAVIEVHLGPVCEQGFTCESGRQLFDDFGVDTDQFGWAHIAFSQDARSNGTPQLGGPFTCTGYAVQTGGDRVGFPN